MTDGQPPQPPCLLRSQTGSRLSWRDRHHKDAYTAGVMAHSATRSPASLHTCPGRTGNLPCRSALPLGRLFDQHNLCFHFRHLSHVRLFVTPWTAAHQAPLSMESSRQECWSGLPFPSPGDLPDPAIKPGSSSLQAYSLRSEPPGKPRMRTTHLKNSRCNMDAAHQG